MHGAFLWADEDAKGKTSDAETAKSHTPQKSNLQDRHPHGQEVDKSEEILPKEEHFFSLLKEPPPDNIVPDFFARARDALLQ